MEKSKLDLKRLEDALRRLKNQAAREGYSYRNFALTFFAVVGVVRIFTQEENKDAERILRELLDYDSEGIKFLVLSTFYAAKSRDKDLDWKTEIRLEKFRNNPVNQDLCDKVFSAVNATQAPFN